MPCGGQLLMGLSSRWVRAELRRGHQLHGIVRRRIVQAILRGRRQLHLFLRGRQVQSDVQGDHVHEDMRRGGLHLSRAVVHSSMYLNTVRTLTIRASAACVRLPWNRSTVSRT